MATREGWMAKAEYNFAVAENMQAYASTDPQATYFANQALTAALMANMTPMSREEMTRRVGEALSKSL